MEDGVPETMRAAVLFGPDDLRVVERPVPRPGPEEVLISVAVCGICGTDLKITYHPFPGQPPFGEFIPGHEYAGRVVALGETVDEFQVGDRVAVEAHKGCGRCPNCIRGMYTACLNYGNRLKGHRATGFTANGGYAEYAVHHLSALYRIPDNVSFEEATLVTTAGTGMYGLDTAGGLVAGDAVVVMGPGPVGLMVVQLCKALGAGTVILTGTRDSRLDLGRRLGADHVINITEANPVPAVLDLTGGGADLTIECSGAQEAPQQALEMTRLGMRVLLLAFYKEPVTLDLNLAIRNDITLYTARGEGGMNCKRCLSLMSQGKIKGLPLITHEFPLERVQEAIQTFRQRRDDAMKVLLRP